jgi:tetratricopeptide (TPR) repeat protein
VRDLPENGAFVDFERLAWLQRLTTETRSLLRSHFPRLPDGAVVGQLHRPLRAAYAFAGDRSLQVWYRDTTLRWLDWERADWRPDSRPVTIVEFLGSPDHPFALVEPEAMRHYTAAEPFKEREAWPAALAELDSADVAQDDRDAWGFRGMVAGRRALCELGMNDLPATERTARRGLALMPENGDARYALVEALAISGRLAEARAHADTLLALYPNDAAVRDLAARLGR